MTKMIDRLLTIGWPDSITMDPAMGRRALADFQAMNCFVSKDRTRLRVDGQFGKLSLYLLDKAAEDGLCSPHFKYREFRSKSNPTWMGGSRYIIDHLEIVRYALDTSVTIESGARTAAHNAAVGGATGSFHAPDPPRSANGPGSDISAVDIRSNMVKLTYFTARELGFRGGIGVVISTGYVRHLDDGPERAWGYNKAGKAVSYTP